MERAEDRRPREPRRPQPLHRGDILDAATHPLTLAFFDLQRVPTKHTKDRYVEYVTPEVNRDHNTFVVEHGGGFGMYVPAENRDRIHDFQIHDFLIQALRDYRPDFASQGEAVALRASFSLEFVNLATDKKAKQPEPLRITRTFVYDLPFVHLPFADLDGTGDPKMTRWQTVKVGEEKDAPLRKQ